LRVNVRARRVPFVTTSSEDEIRALAMQLKGVLEVAAMEGVETLPKPTFTTQTLPAPKPQPPQPTPQPTPQPSPAAPLAIVQNGDDVVGPAIEAIVASPATAAEKLEKLRLEVIGDCRRCKLHRGRSKLVFGVGNPEAKLVFVGEGPGADEDRQGIPFVGRAGQLLTKMIEAMGFSRDDVYICNVLKCRPPNNRDPEPDEVEACERFLKAQLRIVKPDVIVALGKHAAQTLLRSKTPITRLRGTWQQYEGVKLMPTYHPSYLLREESDPEQKKKREAWSDLQQVMKVFGKNATTRRGS
jgi:uracil-DNA glycosylase family 4